MNRLALRLFNAPALVFIAALAIAIQTSFFAPMPLRYFQPDAVLILVIWCALKRGFTEGGVLTLIFSNIAEIHSAAPQGTLMVGYMGVFLLLRVAARALVIEGLPSYLAVTACSQIAIQILHLTEFSLLKGSIGSIIPHTIKSLIPSLAAEVALGAWAYRKLDHFDTITHLKPGSEHGLEDEFHVSEPITLGSAGSISGPGKPLDSSGRDS